MRNRVASPVKDASVAGRQADLNSETRSGLWLHVARAVEALRPCLLVVENVRGLLTSPAGSPGNLEPCPWCLGDRPNPKSDQFAESRRDETTNPLALVAITARYQRVRTALEGVYATHRGVLCVRTRADRRDKRPGPVQTDCETGLVLLRE
ncbi:DNA cytosine methyltransferase [Kitasatospora sp. NPDC004240]